MARVLYFVVSMLFSISLISIPATFGTPISTEPNNPVVVEGVGGHDHIPILEEEHFHENPEEDLSALLSDNQHHDHGYEEEEEEMECPPGQWFHIRGNRCVPYNCVGGNRFRDITTGECLISKGYDKFANSGGERSLSRYNPRVQSHGRGVKGRLRYGLPAKLKG